MFSVIIIAEESNFTRELASLLVNSGIKCVLTAKEEAPQTLPEDTPSAVILDITSVTDNPLDWYLPLAASLKKKPLLMPIIPPDCLSEIAASSAVDDFAVKPASAEEALFRLKRLFEKQAGAMDIIAIDAMVIDLARCEVVLEGEVIDLTFREYELLRFLAANRGRVFSREALLSKVWGYDYFGGDRTVDVHIRRLRSKLNDVTHGFVETVRNVGYRFRRN